jgi:hypothetical protein
LIHCYRDVFSAPLRNIERGADPQKTPLFFLCIRFRGNKLIEQLPGNELFRLSGVMPQYLTLLLRMVEVASLTLGQQQS